MISVCIITRNESDKIQRAVKSAGFADEIIVVDSYSTDGTQDICRRSGCKVFERDFDNFSGVKNFALEKASYEWVFFLDADEIVTEELSNEIINLVKINPQENAFTVRRKVFVFRGRVKWGSAKDDSPVRLLRKTRCSFYQPVHEEVKVEGSVGNLASYLEHHTTASVKKYLEKLNLYTDLEADFMFKKGLKCTLFDLTMKPLLAFVRGYFVKFGFLDGIRGYVFEVFSAYYMFNKYAKLENIIRKNKNEKN